MKAKIFKHIFYGGLFFLLLGCGVTKNYKKAKAKDQITTYQEYLAKYPKSKYKVVAETRLKVLEEERDWLNARKAASISSFERFIQKYPLSPHQRDAQKRLGVLEENKHWEIAQNGKNILHLVHEAVDDLRSPPPFFPQDIFYMVPFISRKILTGFTQHNIDCSNILKGTTGKK